MNFTIEDTRKSISNIYQWMTSNDNFDFIKNSIDDCSSDDYTTLRYQLNVALKKSRGLLNQLAESIDEMDACVKQLRVTIERERGLRAKARKEQKRKDK